MAVVFDYILRRLRKADTGGGGGSYIPPPDASESTKGIVQLATQGEVTAGTNQVKAVTPKTLKTELDKKADAGGGGGTVPDASTSTKGVIQIATGEEVAAGTDQVKAVVPSTLKTELDKKVDKVAGKGLSTNDYTTNEKNKVAAALTSVPTASDTVKGVVNVASLDDTLQLISGTSPTNGDRVPRLSDLHAVASLKVDKVEGKGLSTNDYDNAEKAKVAAAETETTLGIDTASGDTTKFLNQKKQWVVPAGGSGSVPDASTSTKGVIQIATGEEVAAGTDQVKAVVPSTLKTELDKKVDKVAGKGLSTNDYDNAEKAKVAAAETEATLGIDTVSGDTTKFLNQKKQWVVPAGGSGSGPTVELLYTMPALGSGDVGRVALFAGASTGAYVQNNLYRAVKETMEAPTGVVTVGAVTYGAQGEYAFDSGSGDTREWWRRSGGQEWRLRYRGGAWVIHSFDWELDELHNDEYRAVAPSGSNPWDSDLTWESNWEDGMYTGVGGPVPTVTASPMTVYAWRPLLPPLTTFASTTPTIYPGGRYTNFNPSEGVMNGAFTFNIGGYEGCYGDAEVIMVVPPSGVTVSGGTGLTLVDAIATGKRNFCVIKFFGTTANLFVVHTEDLP